MPFCGQIAIRILALLMVTYCLTLRCVMILMYDWCMIDMDPSLWGFEAKEAYDRRAYFWNLLQPILWQASNFSFLVAPVHKFFFRVCAIISKYTIRRWWEKLRDRWRATRMYGYSILSWEVCLTLVRSWCMERSLYNRVPNASNWGNSRLESTFLSNHHGTWSLDSWIRYTVIFFTTRPPATFNVNASLCPLTLFRTQYVVPRFFDFGRYWFAAMCF